MDLILSAAFTSITFTLYLFKKNDLEELKKTKPFPVNTGSESPEAKIEKDVTYYLEGIVSPIKESEFITCTNSKKKAVILKNIINRHSVRWSNFWKDWIPEVEVISINGQSVPFNIEKYKKPQVTIPKLSIQDIMFVDLPVLSDNYINQNKKSIVKSIMDYVNGERFNAIENVEKGFALKKPVTVIGKFKLPESPIPDSTVSIPTSTDSITPSPPALEPEELLVQSTHLPVFLPNFNDEDAVCVLSSKTFKEIIEEEGKEVNKWKWIFIGSTTVIGGVVAFRIWRYYRRKRRAEELERLAQTRDELQRLQEAAYVEPPRNPSIFTMLRDIINWVLFDDIEFSIDNNSSSSYLPHSPITEYIPEPIPPIPDDDDDHNVNNTTTNTTMDTNNTNSNSNSNNNNINNSNTNSPINTTNANADNNNNRSETLNQSGVSTPNLNTHTHGTSTPTSSDENLCVVCLTERREYAFLPCRHLCVCHQCVRYLEKCPLCRTPIQKYMKIFS